MRLSEIKNLKTLDKYCNGISDCIDCEIKKECDEIFGHSSQDLFETLLPIVIKKNRKEKLKKLLS
jgi:hypothetical protein